MTFSYDMEANPSKALAASKAVEQSLVSIEGAAKKTGLSITSAMDEAGRFIATRVVASLESGIRMALQMSDAYVTMGNRLRAVTKNQADLNMTLEATFEIAQRSRTSWESTTEAFVRLTGATKELHLSQSEVLGLTETVGKAIQMSGATASEASAGMMQLTQALGSGRLQGDEFRSMAEAIPSVLDLVAKEMHVTRGALKQLSTDGKITTDVLVSAFRHAKDDIDAGFAKTAPTLAQGWEMFRNEMTKVIGETGLVEKLMPSLAAATMLAVEAVRSLAAELTGMLGVIGGISKAVGGLSAVAGGVSTVLKYVNPMGQGGRAAWAVWEHISEERERLADVFTKEQRQQSAMDLLYDPNDRKYWPAQSNKALEDNVSQMDASINDPIKKHADQLQAVEELWKRGKLSVEQYEEQVKKLSATISDLVRRKEEDQANDDLRVLNAAKRLKEFGGGVIKYPLAEGKTAFSYRDENRQAEADMAALEASDKHYSEQLDERIEKWTATADKAHSAWMAVYRSIRGPEMELRQNLPILTEMLRQRVITIYEYNEALAKLQGVEYNPRSAAEGRAARDIEELNLQKLQRDSGTAIPGAEGLIGGVDAFELREMNRQAIADAKEMVAEDGKWSAAMGDVEQKFSAVVERSKALNKNMVQWFSELNKLRDAQDPLKGLETGLNKIGNEILNLGTLVDSMLVNTFHRLEDAMISAFQGGKVSWGSLVTQIEGDLLRLATRKLLSELIGGIGSLFGGGPTLTGIGLIDWASGGSHDDGGSFRVGGSGGPDSQNVLMRLTPGERLDITPKGSAPSSGGGVNVTNVYDRRQLTANINTREGKRHIVNAMRSDPRAFRGALGR